jgi:hypothetical protein
MNLLTSLGQPSRTPDHSGAVKAIILSQDILRVAPLHLMPNVLSPILAEGLCVLALLISRTRDDLILAAMVSAAGDCVFLAGLLPVGAMTGSIGQLQLVILMGILDGTLADELIDHPLGRVKPRWAELLHWTVLRWAVLRWTVLPSSLLLTLWTICVIFPSGVLQTS